MPRAPRIHYPGAVYHVMARGVDGREVFVNDNDRHDFLRTALTVKSDTPYSILAYCLMGNHFHFALKSGISPISRIMQRILTKYVRGFNSRHDREGHLFQARYKSFSCLDNSYLISLIRYIHMNPVRAGMASKPSDWPWSSYRQYAARTGSPLADTEIFLHATGKQGPGGHRSFERWSEDSEVNFKPWGDPAPRAALLRSDPIEVRPLQKLATDLFPEDVTGLKSGARRRALSQKKMIVAQNAIQAGHSLVSIADWMNCTPQAIHNLLHRNK